MKIQKERDIALAKVESVESLVNNKEVDECIIDSRCLGDCEHVDCNVQQAQRLKELKELGGRRSSPAVEVAPRPWKHCPQCSFKTRTDSELKDHVNKQHGHVPTCPFCNIGFYNLNALGHHIEERHKDNVPTVIENRLPVSQNRHNRRVGSKGVCIFFLQPRGCKKGLFCDFSHGGGPPSVKKVRKLCYNGQGCNWKPRCRYVHPEDGEVIPDRASRDQMRSPHHQPGQLPGQQQQPDQQSSSGNQVFGSPDLRQPPPGVSLTEYPVLGQPQRPSVIRRLMTQGI